MWENPAVSPPLLRTLPGQSQSQLSPQMGSSQSLLLLLLLGVTRCDRRSGYSSHCNSCSGGSTSYNNGRKLGQSVAGAIGNKLQHIAGFVDGLVSGPPAHSGCSACSSSYVPASNPCPHNSCYGSSQTLVVQQSSCSSCSSYPDCQCDYLFNNAGQGNCNAAGARSHTQDRWCYIAEEVNGRWIEAQWACPDAVRSDVHHGRLEI